MRKKSQKKNTIEFGTPEWLRTFEGCEHYTNEEAQEILFSIEQLAKILIENEMERQIKNTKH